MYRLARPKTPLFTKTRLAIGFGLCFSYIGYRQGSIRYRELHHSNMYETLPDTEVLTQEYFGEHKILQFNIWQRCYYFLRRSLRAVHLALKFAPLILTLPLAWLFKRLLFPYWLELMLYTLQSAGALWIKLGQWASHRGDIFGEDITRALERMRDQASPHKMSLTHAQFEQEFGVKIFDTFEFFNEKPVASGSIAQIYKARLNGQNVAIKVRHPDIIKKMEMDIRILYSIANFLGRTVFKQLAMPITFDEFKRSLVSQTDLRFEARNLNIFIEKFQHNPNVVFPKPIDPYVSSSVLTETYEEGVSLSKYLDEKPSQLHHRIANLGLKAFYKMLIYDNFIHADCHAGNIFVRVVPAPSTENLSNWQKFQGHVENVQDIIFEKVEQLIEYSMGRVAEWQINRSQTQSNMQTLQQEKTFDEKSFISQFTTVQNKDKIQIIFLDPGMVTILNKNDRAAFIKLVMYVTLRKPIECGYLMLQLSQYHHGKKKVTNEMKRKFIGDMEDLFESVCAVPLSQMNIGQVLRSMLEILRANGMSIEGHFASLLMNMIVLEGIAKQLDPQINIVAQAASFLLKLQTIDKTINEIIQQTL